MPKHPKIKILISIASMLAPVIITAGIAPAQGQWSPPVRISEPGGCLYPQILAFGDTLHVVYEDVSGYFKISYVRSTDGGQTWDQPVVLSARANTTIWPQIVGRGCRLMALWVHSFPTGIYRYNIGYARSTDGGASWEPTQYVFNPNVPGITELAAAGTDTLINVIFAAVGYNFIKTTDFGVTWSTPTTIVNPYQFSKPDCASLDSLVHFIWDGRFDSDHNSEIYYTKSTDGGRSWTPNIALSDTDQYHSQLPAMCVDGVGNPSVTWMDYKHSPYFTTGDIFLRASADSGATWGPERQITLHHLAEASDIAQGGDTVAVTWNDTRGENGWRSIYCTIGLDGGETWGEADRLDDDPLESFWPSVAISNGKIYVVWYDTRCDPDSLHCRGIYFSKFAAEPDRTKEIDEIKPEQIGLMAYPNPFNAATTITVAGKDKAEIAIYDVTGRRVATLHAENGKAVWEAEGLGSGVYFARAMWVGGTSVAIKLIYLK